MIQVFSHSEPGGHRENEDAFAIGVHPTDPACQICVIADGQGGQAGGGVAARRACAICLETAANYPPNKLFQPRAWGGIVRAVDGALCKDPTAGFTTLVAFCLKETAICGASCGDSAAILLQPSGPGSILTAHQRKNPPVGSGEAAFEPLAALLPYPWAILAMTDGVWKYAGLENILNLKPGEIGQTTVAALRDRAQLRRSGKLQDDFTLIAFRYADR